MNDVFKKVKITDMYDKKECEFRIRTKKGGKELLKFWNEKYG